MKILILVTTFFFVQNLNAFQSDSPEKFESIILEKPWFVQIGLADRWGFAIQPDYNYSLSVGKYLGKNYALKVGINYGNNILDIEQASTNNNNNVPTKFEYDTYTYGFNIVGLYNFMPSKRLQFSAGLFAEYEYANRNYDEILREYSGTTLINSNSIYNIYRFGTTLNINYFILRNISLYIQNLLLFTVAKQDSKATFEFPDGLTGHNTSTGKTKSVRFDNLLLGLGIYF